MKKSMTYENINGEVITFDLSGSEFVQEILTGISYDNLRFVNTETTEPKKQKTLSPRLVKSFTH